MDSRWACAEVMVSSGEIIGLEGFRLKGRDIRRTQLSGYVDFTTGSWQKKPWDCWMSSGSTRRWRMPATRRQLTTIRKICHLLQTFASLYFKLGDWRLKGLRYLGVDEPAPAPGPCCCGPPTGDTLRRFLIPDCSFERTGATQDASEMGISQMEGMISSGPVRVHDEESDSVDSVVLPSLFRSLSRFAFGSRVGLAGS